MATLVVQHEVEDYDVWRPLFDAHSKVRKEYGCSAERVFRAADDPNLICIVLEMPSAEQVSGFLKDPTLASAMAEAGVTSRPVATIGDSEPV